VLEIPGCYEVDLERCLDTAEVLHYVAQVADKGRQRLVKKGVETLEPFFIVGGAP
jgi:hypothetical protein